MQSIGHAQKSQKKEICSMNLRKNLLFQNHKSLR